VNKYRITWDEHISDAAVIEADGPAEALEVFWVAHHAGHFQAEDEWHETSGPQAVHVLGVVE
jgi:hypothetical protein